MAELSAEQVVNIVGSLETDQTVLDDVTLAELRRALVVIQHGSAGPMLDAEPPDRQRTNGRTRTDG